MEYEITTSHPLMECQYIAHSGSIVKEHFLRQSTPAMTALCPSEGSDDFHQSQVRGMKFSLHHVHYG